MLLKKSLPGAEIFAFKNMKKNLLLLLISSIALAASFVFLAYRPQINPTAPIANTESQSASTSGSKEIPLYVAIEAEGKRYEIKIRSEKTVYEAMRAAASSGFTFSGREYPSLGFFVESINGKKAPQGYYWIFYMNGKQSQTGISQTPISAGDTIEWRLEATY